MLRSRNQTGAVTAEAAVVLPLLGLMAFGLTWVISLAVVEARAQDAAREAARVVARGESTAAGVAEAERVATAGAGVTVHRGSDEVVVEVTAPVRGPGGMLRVLPSLRIRAQAVAALEPGEVDP